MSVTVLYLGDRFFWGHNVCILKFLLSDCCFALGFHDQTSELCHKCYSYQWNTESYAACWCARGNTIGLV